MKINSLFEIYTVLVELNVDSSRLLQRKLTATELCDCDAVL